MADTVQISATVPVELHQRLRIAAETTNQTRSELIIQALTEYFEKHKL